MLQSAARVYSPGHKIELMEEDELVTEAGVVMSDDSASQDDSPSLHSLDLSPNDTTTGPLVRESKHRDVYAGFANRLDKVHRLVQTMLRTKHTATSTPEHRPSETEPCPSD